MCDRHWTEFINDVIGVPTESIQRMYVRALLRREHLGGPVVRGAMAFVEVLAQRIALREGDAALGQKMRGGCWRCRHYLPAVALGGVVSNATCRKFSRHQHHWYSDTRHGG